MSQRGGRLCDSCQSLFRIDTYAPSDRTRSTLTGNDEFKRIVKIPDIRRGARERCTICTIIGAGVDRVSGPADVEPEDFHNLREISKGGFRVLLLRHANTEMFLVQFSLDADLIATFHSYRSDDTNWPNLPSHGDYTGGGQTWEYIRQWAVECNSTHQSCRWGSMPNWIPPRVLDVSPNNGARVKLETAGMSNGGIFSNQGYITLSHCWGFKKILRLERNNYEAFKSGIPYDELPKTFKHAIELTRKMGFRYLWIDSLCIIQDDVEDWREQASLMAEIYQRSFITIAASGARDGSDGLYFHRSPAHIDPCPVAVQWDPNRSATRKFVVAMPAEEIITKHFHQQPLVSRGWVMQERLLSPRTVHFGRIQVFWTCKQLRASEAHETNGVLSFAPDEFYGSTTLDRIWGRGDTAAGAGDDKMLAPAEFWHRAVEQYSSCRLTRESDKLVAISGIAARLHKVAKEHLGAYRAGLWERTILEDLLWGPRAQKSPVRQYEYRAPTWSWASIDGHVEYQLTHGPADLVEYFAKVEGADIALAGKDPFGGIEHATMRMRCLLVDVAEERDSRFETHEFAAWPDILEFSEIEAGDVKMLLVKTVQSPPKGQGGKGHISHYGILVRESWLPETGRTLVDRKVYKRIGVARDHFGYGTDDRFIDVVEELSKKALEQYKESSIILV